MLTHDQIEYDWGREDALVGYPCTSQSRSYRLGYLKGLWECMVRVYGNRPFPRAPEVQS